MSNHPLPTSITIVRRPAIRVIVTDTHPIVRAGIKNELAYHGDIQILGEAGDVQTTLQLLQSHSADVLVLDADIPGIRCIELLECIVTLPQQPRVLIVTAHREADFIARALAVGAAGYLLKDEEPAVIPMAIRSVARGDIWISPAVAAAIVNRFVKKTSTPMVQLLSTREMEVLQALAEGKENQEIGELLSISERTVRFHLRNIYDKLKMRRSEAIAWWLQQKH